MNQIAKRNVGEHQTREKENENEQQSEVGRKGEFPTAVIDRQPSEMKNRVQFFFSYENVMNVLFSNQKKYVLLEFSYECVDVIFAKINEPGHIFAYKTF